MAKGYSIRVNICGKSFNIISDDKPDYLTDVADRVDKSISAMLFSNPSLTFEKAAVLAALKFCDDAKKKEVKNDAGVSDLNDTEANNLRRQVIEYSKELARLTKENKELKKNISGLKKEYDEKIFRLQETVHNNR